jgi:hypothetical protein
MGECLARAETIEKAREIANAMRNKISVEFL